MSKSNKIEEVATKIGQALARGYCYQKNADKCLDADLINAMAEEVERVWLAENEEAITSQVKLACKPLVEALKPFAMIQLSIDNKKLELHFESNSLTNAKQALTAHKAKYGDEECQESQILVNVKAVVISGLAKVLEVVPDVAPSKLREDEDHNHE